MRILLLDGNENQAVAAVRSLDRAGHDVRVGADTPWSKAGWSRHAHGSFHYPSPRSDPAAFIQHLTARAAQQDGTLVLPLTESSTLPISLHRDALLHAGARLVLPSHDTVLRAFDKQVTRKIAEAAGVCTPHTVLVESFEAARDAAARIGYPIVLKGAASEQTDAHGRTRAAGAPLYARSDDALERAFATLHARVSRVLVQAFVHGEGSGYYALMDHGSMRAEFAHRRIRDVRPTGSGSALRESIPIDPAMRDASLRILEALDWHGVAMVEYRRRPDGTLVFLEVNGRFWNSLALAIHAGVDFPALLVRLAAGKDVGPPPDYRTGVRCRWLLGDARHLAAVLAGPPADYPGPFPRRLPTLFAVLRPSRGTRHDHFTLRDPLPALGDWIHFLFRRVPRALRARSAQ